MLDSYAPIEQYAYDSQGKRVWDATLDGSGNVTGQTVYLYGVDGRRIATYPSFSTTGINAPGTLELQIAGRRIAVIDPGYGAPIIDASDRLGSLGSFFPYGELRSGPSGPDYQIQTTFATYLRDSSTNLDYADQRYYSSPYGRFMTPDPYQASATSPSDPKSPQSWNRYAYVSNDPINSNDRSGENEPEPCAECGGGGGWNGWDCGPVYVDGFEMPSPCITIGGAPEPTPTQPAPPPDCGDAIGANLLASNQVEAAETVMGENSWYLLGTPSYLPNGKSGPLITTGMVYTEDVDMFSVFVNRTQAPGYPSTIGAVASQPGQFTGYNNGPTGGITKYNNAFNSLATSSPCADLFQVITAMTYVLDVGSALPGNYLYWKAINQGGGVFHVYRPGDIYVANTAFSTVN